MKMRKYLFNNIKTNDMENQSELYKIKKTEYTHGQLSVLNALYAIGRRDIILELWNRMFSTGLKRILISETKFVSDHSDHIDDGGFADFILGLPN